MPNASAPLGRDAARALVAAYREERSAAAAHRLALACAAALIEHVPAPGRPLVLHAAADERHGLHTLHRLEYLRAYQDRLHGYALPDGICAERMAQAALRTPASPGATVRALKEIAGLLGRVDGNARLRAGGQEPEPFEGFDLAWQGCAARAGREGAGPALLDALLDGERRAALLARGPAERKPSGPAGANHEAAQEAAREAAPRPPVREHVLGPGSDLERGLRAAPAGATVRLAPGEHRLREPLFVRGALTLIGEEGVRIRASFPGQVVVVEREGVLELREIDLAHEGGTDADLLHVEGSARLVACRLAGARGRVTDARRHASLEGIGCLVLRGGQARLEECVIDGVAAAAAQGEGESRLELVGCTVRGGAQAVVARDRAEVVVTRCDLAEQEVAAVLATGAAHVALLENTVLGDHDAGGFVFLERASGEARGNEVISSGEGLRLAPEARVVEEGNEFRERTPFD